MTKHCPICWIEVNPDGCAFSHNNRDCPLNTPPDNILEYHWIAPEYVFDTETMLYGVK